MTPSIKATLLLLALLLTAAGCGKSGPAVVPVEGKITYGGGPWPRSGMLYFTPDQPAAGFPRRPAWAEFTADGTFRVTSFSPNDGLVPGRYRIGVECWENPPTMGGKTPVKSCVPPKYRSPTTSELSVDIKAGQEKAMVKLDVPKT